LKTNKPDAALDHNHNFGVVILKLVAMQSTLPLTEAIERIGSKLNHHIPIQKVTGSIYNNFISEKAVVIVHFPAAWNGIGNQMRSIIVAAAKVLGDRVNFGELDADENQRTAAES
jgi:hypothetical protein